MADVGALRITLGLNSIDFTNGMKQANQRLTALNSEFKAITSGAAKFDNSLETLRSRADVLTRTMQVHQAKIAELKQRYEESKTAKGEDAEETVKLAAAYNRAVVAMKQTELQLQNVNRRIDEQTDGFKKLEAEINDSMGNIDRELRVLQSGFAAATASIENFGDAEEDLRQKEQHLVQTMELQRRQVDELQRLYDESARAKGKDAAETQELEIRMNQATQAMRETERQLNATTAEIKQQSNAWANLSQSMDASGAVMQERGSTLLSIGQGLSVGVTLPLTALAVTAGIAANSFDASVGRIEARMGVTEERANELSLAAQDVWKNGFGEGMREASDAITLVSNNLKGISDQELRSATEAAFFLSEAFDADVNESTRAAGQIMKDFGDSSSKAFDLVTWGFQNGLDYTGEFLDTIREYSPQFSEMGYSSEKMLNTLKAGFDAGSWSLDKLGDSIKESHLRFQDMSKGTVDAYKTLGLSAEEYSGKIAKGGEEGNKAFQEVVTKLMNVKDATERNTLSTALFGTQYEDLREKIIFAMLGAGDSIEGLEGTTKRAADSLHDNFGDRMQKLWRNFQKDLEPVGEDILEIAEDILPKLAESAEDITDAFANMSPEGQKFVLALGGMALAAGPVLSGIGALTIGAGLLTQGLSPLIASIGAGGLAGSFAFLTNPITLTVAGLGLATAATIGIMDATEKAKEVNLEHATSLVEQQTSLEGLTKRYEELRDKNKLSNDELLQFRDIQSDLKTAGTAEEVKNLSAQADALREKSGLSNEELSEMLGLNDKLIEKVPTASQVFSDQGSAVLKNADDLNTANEALREQIRLELEIQKTKADAKLDSVIRDQAEAVEELKTKYKEMDEAKSAVAEKEVALAELKQQFQEAEEAGHTRIATALENDILLLESQIARQNQNVVAVASEVQERAKSVEQKNAEIAKIQEIYAELINLQLAQAGINATGAEGIAQLDQVIVKTQTRIGELNTIQAQHGSLNAEQQKELETLNTALGVYTSTKGEIQNIQGEQAAVNAKIDEGTGKAGEMTAELDKDVNKDVNVDDHGKAKQITDEANKGANKDVNVTDNGKAKAISDEASKSVTKNVIINAIGTGLKAAAQAIGIPGFAKGSPETPEGFAVVGEEGPELVYLPGGAKVIPNPDTEAILKKWNVPMMATGGVTLTSGMAYVGEQGREIVDLRGAAVSNTQVPQPQSSSMNEEVIRLLQTIAENIGNDIYLGMEKVGALMDQEQAKRTGLYGRRLAY